MKKFLLPLLCAIITWACAKNENPNPENPDIQPGKEFIVSLGMTGEILDIEESPLSKASGNDLYGVQVYSRANSSDSYKPYAYGLFDDKSKMSVKLLEGYEYEFEVTMVVDGCNKIFFQQGYTAPFGRKSTLATTVENTFTYETSDYFQHLDWGYARYSTEHAYKHANTERFYGVTSNYIPNKNTNVKIDMKRVCFGVKFVAKGLSEGTLKINMEDAPEMQISANGAQEVQDMFTFQNIHPGGIQWTLDNYSEETAISITWIKEDGTTIPLTSQNITFKRNILTTITINIDDEFIHNGFDISQETGDMQEGENIVVN